jgi:hypothetical protein
VAGDLFVTNSHEVDRAFSQSSQNRDVCVATEAEDVLHIATLKKVDNVFCDCLFLAGPYAIS